MKKVRAKIANILVNVANVLIRDIEDLQGVSLDENSFVKCTCGHSKNDHFKHENRTICICCNALASHRFEEKDALEADTVFIEE